MISLLPTLFFRVPKQMIFFLLGIYSSRDYPKQKIKSFYNIIS